MEWLPPTVTVEPAEEPVTLAEAKAQCRVLDDYSDAELTAYIAAARRHVETYCGIKLVSQTVTVKGCRFAALESLPIAPVQSVSNLKYLDTAGTEQTLATSVYEAALDGLAPFIRLKAGQAWPGFMAVPDAIRLTLICGYGDAADVPADIKLAMRLLIADWFRVREDTNVGSIVNPMPNGVRALLENYRRH